MCKLLGSVVPTSFFLPLDSGRDGDQLAKNYLVEERRQGHNFFFSPHNGTLLEKKQIYHITC